jgi:transcriptional regulator with XRE-family HTH domain
MEWALRIKAFRRHLGYKQTAAAEALGISQATLSKWEAGLFQPTAAAKSFIYKALTQDDDNAIVARSKFWINRSQDRHVLYNVSSGQIIAMSPASLCAQGIHNADKKDLFIRGSVHESQQITRESMEAILLTWDKDILRISTTAKMYDAQRNRLVIGQHDVMPLFVGSTVYVHACLSPAEGLNDPTIPRNSYTIHTIYGDELTSPR